jgi:hypothetical protein
MASTIAIARKRSVLKIIGLENPEENVRFTVKR